MKSTSIACCAAPLHLCVFAITAVLRLIRLNAAPRHVAGFEGGDAPSINRRLLDDLRALELEGRRNVLARVIALYLDEAPRLLKDLRLAIERQDGPGVAQAAHALKSSSGNLGAERVVQLCRQLEGLGQADALASAGTLLKALQAEYAAAAGVLEQERMTATA